MQRGPPSAWRGRGEACSARAVSLNDFNPLFFRLLDARRGLHPFALFVILQYSGSCSGVRSPNLALNSSQLGSASPQILCRGLRSPSVLGGCAGRTPADGEVALRRLDKGNSEADKFQIWLLRFTK